MEILDLTNVDAASAYHNWLERQRFTHSVEIEHAFKEGWRILSEFIAGPMQKEVDWFVVNEAVHDAADIDGIGPEDLRHSFVRHALFVVHKKIEPAATSKRVMLCSCGAVLETPTKYAEHCSDFPDHFTQSTPNTDSQP